MSRDLSPATVESINAPLVKPFFAIELMFDNNLIRMWTGVGTLVLPDGTSWVGTGTMLDVSAIEETAEMSARGATLKLSSVAPELLALALAEPYQGRVANIYFGTFGISPYLTQQNGAYILLQDGGKILAQIGDTGFNQLFSGYMDQMNIDDGAETSSIELKIENRLVDLERARVARYTNQFQKSLYPTDEGLSFVEGLQDRKVPWGRSDG